MDRTGLDLVGGRLGLFPYHAQLGVGLVGSPVEDVALGLSVLLALRLVQDLLVEALVRWFALLELEVSRDEFALELGGRIWSPKPLRVGRAVRREFLRALGSAEELCAIIGRRNMLSNDVCVSHWSPRLVNCALARVPLRRDVPLLVQLLGHTRPSVLP
jgi:hypothetical protein